MCLVPRVPPFDRPATYDDLVKLPPNLVAEIVAASCTPHRDPPRHTLSRALDCWTRSARLFHDGEGGPGGWWILHEPELHLGA